MWHLIGVTVIIPYHVFPTKKNKNKNGLKQKPIGKWLWIENHSTVLGVFIYLGGYFTPLFNPNRMLASLDFVEKFL